MENPWGILAVAVTPNQTSVTATGSIWDAVAAKGPLPLEYCAIIEQHLLGSLDTVLSLDNLLDLVNSVSYVRVDCEALTCRCLNE